MSGLEARSFVVSLAEKEGIPYQVAVRRKGGTDGGPLHRAGTGSPAVVLVVLVYEACLNLMISACRALTGEVLPSIFP